MIFDRKIVRQIYEAWNEEGIWRVRKNKKIEQILENENIVKYIKLCRIRWLGLVERMNKERILKRVMHATRRQGRPMSRWIDEVKKYLQQMRIRNRRNVVKDRDNWRRIVLEAKAIMACRAYERKRACSLLRTRIERANLHSTLPPPRCRMSLMHRTRDSTAPEISVHGIQFSVGLSVTATPPGARCYTNLIN
ncbi:Hypothetical protein CINCED_3A006707 [Cinara cedri]|uniref:Endonuclease-reverse transcriptase n=1 Tax=Cinara cedri TaxID=506608 RepID=A0A5E4ML16_9HEMI|nr:Hypothetical protein CINCED_3A006707 [Cinara cedri]